MTEGIRAPNVPLGISIADFWGFEDVGGKKSLRRYPRAAVLGSLEAMAAAAQAGGGIVFKTLADAAANRNYPANQLAWVTQDPISGNNGIYQKNGSSGAGSWVWVAELPYSFYVADNTGAGSANAIQATSAYPIPAEKALIVFKVTDENTSSTVTVSFNDNTPLTIKTSSGASPAVGGFVENMLLAGYIHGTEFRLITDQASAAIQTAAENAASSAVSSAASALNSKNEAAAITGSGSVTYDAGAVSVQTALEKSYYLAKSVVDTRAEMAGLDVTKSDIAMVKGEGAKNGVFFLRAYADYSDDVTADVREGYVVRSTNDTSKVWVRDIQDGTYMLDWFVTDGASKTTQSAEFKDALESVPSGSIVKLRRFKQYDLYETSASTRGHIEIDGNCALINNTTQAYGPYPDSLPILRVLAPVAGSDYRAYDVTVKNLLIQGPRLTTDTTRGLGGYGGDPLSPGVGYPSGLDIPRGRTITIDHVASAGSFYAGIEAHYGKKIVVSNCSIANHGFSGVTITDTEETHVFLNTIDDIGSAFFDAEQPTLNDGYGINLGTSYNTPNYTTFNTLAFIHDNTVSRCKRKLLDVHNCKRPILFNNQLTGAGYAHIEVVAEGKDKLVDDIQIIDNKIYNRSDFNSGKTAFACISFGGSTPSVNGPIDGHVNAMVKGNQIRGVDAEWGIVGTTSSTSGTEMQSVIIAINSITESVFASYGIGVNPGTEKIALLNIDGNHVYANCTLGHILLKAANSANASLNICAGTTGAERAVSVDESVDTPALWRNILNGAVQDTVTNVA